MNSRYIIKVALVRIDAYDMPTKEETTIYSCFSFVEDSNPQTTQRVSGVLEAIQETIDSLVTEELTDLQLRAYTDPTLFD